MNSRLLVAGCAWLCLVCGPAVMASQPPLSITNVGGNIAVSWSVTGGNWALEGSPVLSTATAWSAVIPALEETNGAIRRVAILAGDTNRFFRLRRLDSGVPGLTGRWQLDEGAGQVAQDGSGAGATLMIEGGSWAGGRIGPGSLQFNGLAGASGSRCWVSNSNAAILPAAGEPFSLSFWIRPETLTTGIKGLAGSDANGAGGWYLALGTTGPGTNHLVLAGTGPGSSLSVTGRTLLLPRQWYYVTATYDGSVASLYLDGARLASGAWIVPAQGSRIYFGGGVGGYDSFHGRIDDIRTFTRCLPEERVALNGEWLFDEGPGAFCADSSAGENHAMLESPSSRAPGHSGGGIDLEAGPVVIPNGESGVLPPDGRPFSVSFWLRPTTLAPGRYGLLSTGVEGVSGWQMTGMIGDSGQAILQITSTNFGGTLDLSVPVTFAAGVWAKLDLTFNGGMATVYCNGRKVRASVGAIRGSRAPIVVGNVAGLPNFRGVLDELRIYSQEKGESEIGPVAPVMWETVLLNTITNFALRGSVLPGRPLIYTLESTLVPTNGTVTLNANSSSVTYKAGNRKGPDAFTYTVSDGEFTSAPAVFRVSVVEPHWVSPTGGPVGSQDGRSASTAWPGGTARALDALLRTNNYYDCFLYAPGEFQSTGWKYAERSTANPGCKHIGSGSTGPNRTILKLVDVWEPHGEGVLFGFSNPALPTDDFEIHRMVLDCNAANNPQQVTGEPVWIRVPVSSTGRVDSVTLRWGSGSAPTSLSHRVGRASRFRVQALRLGVPMFTGNYSSLGTVDSVPIGVEADEILLQLEQRAPGVDYYGLKKFEVAGETVSMPWATTPGGAPSRLDSAHTASFATDGDASTAWASGPEAEARICFPLAAGTVLDRVTLRWNCKTIPGSGRLGAAAAYSIEARNESTGEYHVVPFVRSVRNADGTEAVTFGTVASPTPISCDSLALVLTQREPTVDFYSLREVGVWNGSIPVPIRQPTSLNNLGNAGSPISNAVDDDPDTQWVSNTQGAVTAILVCGSNLKFHDLSVVGFGTKAGRECFPVAIGPQNLMYPPFSGNISVEDCRFSNPSTNNSDGLTALSVRGTPYVSFTNAVVRRCSVTGLRSYFSPYSQALSAVHVENSFVSDCSRAVYFEPDRFSIDSVGPVLLRSNQFINVDSGVILSFHSDARFDSLLCLDNEIVLSGAVPGQAGIAACDVCLGQASGTITNLTAVNNIVRYADWAPRPDWVDVGLLYSDIRNAVFANNLIALRASGTLEVRGCPVGDTPPAPPFEDCDHYDSGPPGPSIPIPCLDELRPGYRRAWLNNRDFVGDLLPVRVRNNGAYVPAAQQQWPE